ncbi:hypothetical protein [Phyllobacterium sp. YR531]|uniref:hypothetical protein n=1 Tax=Phyllobacterium sp. YR531 TaxID=1144343 RepID=UPI00026F98BD|nr:hypothetical protein [Phyllobacterium sp. YR531]EJN03660.1 hypothetical protein PMI41_02369 [Phyllobacterium sp. YR531]
MTTVSAAVAATVPVDATATQSIASQNLFEHMSGTIQTLPHGASPADLGRSLVNDLKGFVERSGKFVNRSNETEKGTSPQSFTSTGSGGNKSAKVEGDAITRVVQELGTVFDHSIETQMVVRGTTQMTGAANTLVKGQ